MSWSRAALDDPINTMSSAKNKDATFCEQRSIPSPEELSSRPRLLMKREKSSGLKLHPETILYLIVFFRDFWVTLLDSLGEPELVCIVTIDHEAEAVIPIHTFDKGECFPTKTKLLQLGKKGWTPYGIIGLD